MLLTVHVQVDLAKRRRERTGSYSDGHGNGRVTSQIEHGDDVMSTVDVLWVVALAFPDDGGV
jgi:hypothetical protein